METELREYVDSLVVRDRSADRWREPISYRAAHGCVCARLLEDPRRHIIIEEVTFAPNTIIRPHRHPGISVADFGISGSGCFQVRHRSYVNDESIAKTLPLYVPAGVTHGGQVGSRGAIVLSVQHWRSWTPWRSIFDDWEDA